MREVYAASPSDLRGRRGRVTSPGAVTMRLAVRTPFAGTRLLDFLAHHLVPGVEVAGPGWYARTLDLPHGPGTVRLELTDAPVAGEMAFVRRAPSCTTCATRAPRSSGRGGCPDADCDPLAVDDQFAGYPAIGPLVRTTPD